MMSTIFGQMDKDRQHVWQETHMQDVRQDPRYMPPPASPIQTALALLDGRISDLQATTERLFSSLKPVTQNTDDNRPSEPCATRSGSSSLFIDINAMADRIGAIAIALQLQVDRLEV